MKKTISVLAAAALFLSFASCGRPKAEAVVPENPAAAVQTEELQMAPKAPAEPAAPAEAVRELPEPKAEPAEAVPAAAPESDKIKVEGNGYEIEFVSAKKGRDASGNPVVLINYRFTNKSGATDAFWNVFSESISQCGQPMSANGVALDYSVLSNSYESVSAGQTIICTYGYPYYSETDPISLKMSIFNYATQAAVATASGTVYITEE